MKYSIRRIFFFAQIAFALQAALQAPSNYATPYTFTTLAGTASQDGVFVMFGLE